MKYSRYKYIQIPVALFFIIVIVSGIGYVLYLAVFDYGKVPDQGYFTPHSKDTSRILADDPQSASIKVSQVMYPSITSANTSKPNSLIVIPMSVDSENNRGEQQNWNNVFAFAPLSKWTNSPMILLDRNTDSDSDSGSNNSEQTTTTMEDIIKSIAPLANTSSMPNSPLDPSSPALIPISNLEGSNIKSMLDFSSSTDDPTKLAAEVDELISDNFSMNREDSIYNRVILAPADNPQFSLLAASWSSYSGDPLLFVNKDSIPDETLQRLEAKAGAEGQQQSQEGNLGIPEDIRKEENNQSGLFIYLVAPSGYITENVRQQLSELGDLRVPELTSDPYDASVKLAKYRDFDTGFGWGLDRTNIAGNSEAGYFNYVVVNPSDIGMGAAALPLSHSAKFGPILYSDKDYIPPVVDNYLWSTKADFFMTPAEGPYNHYWIVGDTESDNGISYIVQSRFDYGTEIGAYRMQGAGMSSLEALFAGWISFSIFGMIYVGISMRKSLKNVSVLQKLAWPLVVLMLGPFGLIAYWLSFNGRKMIEMKMPNFNGSEEKSGDNNHIQNPKQSGNKDDVKKTMTTTTMVMWERPTWSQAIVATLVAVAFAASSMITTSYLIEFFFGFPLQVIDGPFYWFGNGMIITIAISYTVAAIVSLFVFQAPMFAQQRKQEYRKVLKVALVAVLASMTSVSLGMMTLMYFMHMWWLPMTPEEDDLAWFGSMFFSTLVGAVIAMPVNYLLVRRGIKVGEM
ncbi:MAG: DUF4396 domain-containing protein [Candidatus Nitrosocosmicus sp.]